MRRNVRVSTNVRVDDDGEGRQIIPLFAAYQKKLKLFRETSLINTIPATDKFQENVSGTWFVNRHEVAPGTEIMIEYQHKGSTGFSAETEYLLLRADPNAALWQLRLDLPPHHLSSVPHVFFEGRFDVVDNDDMLSDHAREVWMEALGLDKDEYALSDILEPNQEERYFRQIELEGRLKAPKKAVVETTAAGKQRLKIRRTRNVKLR